tara:strand:+ start:103 stop:744 length:642 start_codon:yes stop_codon:yes gene_type:complete
MTYIELINSVLVRLREEPVAAITENDYSALIAQLVNVAKRDVENAYNWEALRKTVSLITVPGTFHYKLLGTTTDIRTLDVYNYTNTTWMESRTTEWMDRAFAVTTVTTGSPTVYAWNGVSDEGDVEVDLYPIPDVAQRLRFNMTSPQKDLKAPGDRLYVPAMLVVENAVARAIEERGEDGGSPNQQLRYQSMLADSISMESSRKPIETIWRAV